MVAAILGLVGVILGLAIGRGYGFWSSRRGELAETIVALAVIQEELRNVQTRHDPPADPTPLKDAWREHRKWLVIHFSPDDYRLLADAVEGRESAVFEPADLTYRLGALYSLFWEEHEAFILVPLIHYLKGNTVSKRVRTILDPSKDPGVGSAPPAIRSWHSPRRDQSRGS